MHSSTLLALFSSALLVSSTPVTSRSAYSVKESHSVPAKWKRAGPAPAEHVLRLQIGLKQSRLDELERHLIEVSNPYHSRYGQYLSAAEVEELAKPSTKTFNLVHEWLQEHGIETHQLEYSPAKDWISVSLPVGIVEGLIATNYSVFEHEEGHQAVRTPSWSLPIHLHAHIETIQPTNSFFALERRQPVKVKQGNAKGGQRLESRNTLERRADVPQPCKAKYWDGPIQRHQTTLDCVRTLYGTKDYVPKASDKVSMGAVNYLGEDTRRDDVELFMSAYRPDTDAQAAAQDYTITLINGAEDDQTCDDTFCNSSGENQKAATDAEYMMGIAYPTKFTSYKVEGTPPFNWDFDNDGNGNEAFLEWTNYVLKQSKIPDVVSQSWSDEEQTVPKSYAQAVCNQLMQITSRGVSLIFESGNWGVGPSGYCTSTLYAYGNAAAPRFLPRFPASCPWVTSVGATQNFAPEKVAYVPNELFGNFHRFSSGAGYSDYFPRPSYQSSVVPAYTSSVVSKLKYAKNMYNATGRAYPDLAAQGVDMATSWDGAERSIVHGTDVSAPIVGGIFALVNDAVVAAGGKPMGFLNPFIYATGASGKGFTDVTTGSTMGCGNKGFPAAKGWDAASGWGTPRFTELRDAALAFQGIKA